MPLLMTPNSKIHRVLSWGPDTEWIWSFSTSNFHPFTSRDGFFLLPSAPGIGNTQEFALLSVNQASSASGRNKPLITTFQIKASGDLSEQLLSATKCPENWLLGSISLFTLTSSHLFREHGGLFQGSLMGFLNF